MLTTIPGPPTPEPYWILVPINPLSAPGIKSLTITYEDGSVEDVALDRVSQSYIR